MASTEFQFVDNQTLLPVDIVDGAIFTSSDQVNGAGNDLSTGVRVIFDYHDLQFTLPGPVELQGVVEGKTVGGQFYNVAYQFCTFRFSSLQQKRQVIVSPDLSVVDVGIDNIIFVGGSTVEQISNQQGLLPAIWRVRVIIQDPNSLLTSVRMSIYGERFNTFQDAGTILTDTKGDPLVGGNVIIT